MTPKLTDEMREALDRQPGRPIEIEDDRTQRVYLLVARETFSRLIDDTLRQALKIGLDQSDRGASAPWDADAFLDEAHRRHDDHAPRPSGRPYWSGSHARHDS